MASAAEGLGMHLKKIPLSSIEKPGSLVGFERTYVGAKAGAIATGQIEGGTKKVFYMLDELEKCPREVQNTLLSLLDDQAKFKDLYYNCEIDLSQSIFGITTNELEKLHGTALYDRIKPFVIKVERYDDATKAAIGKLKLNAALKDNKMADRVVIKDEIFDLIAKATTDDGGRETTQIAERQIITKLKNLLVNAKEGEKVTVDKDFIQDLLKK
jgi:ATP-dependent Lon protease